MFHFRFYLPGRHPLGMGWWGLPGKRGHIRYRWGTYNYRIPGTQLDRVKRIWYLSPMRAAKVQASLRIRAVSPEPSLLAHTSSESRGTFRQKAKSLAPLNGWACAVEICHDGMLEDTNSPDGAQMIHRNVNITEVVLNWARAWQINSEDLNQTWHPPSVISVIAVQSVGSQGPKVSTCGQWRLWSDCADAQADLSLRWAHRSFCFVVFWF